MKSEPLRERRVFIGLGSNLGDRVENLRQAICLMQVHGLKVLRVSSLYETEPVETCEPQPNYINAVAEVVTDLPLPKLLEVLEQIERKLGRESKATKSHEPLTWTYFGLKASELIPNGSKFPTRDFGREPSS